MRFYDAYLNREFNMDHPFWQANFKTKAGTVRKSLSRECFLLALKSLPSLQLVPSVTTVSSIIDGFGTFGAGAGWGRNMTLEAVKEVGMVDLPKIKAIAIEKMTSARDSGSHNHEVMENYLTAEMCGQQPMLDKDDLEMARIIRAAITKVIDEDIEAIEMPLTSGTYSLGGRCDVLTTGTVLDFKFPTELRKPKASELAQVSAYALMADKSHGCLFIWDAANKRVVPHALTPKDINCNWQVMRCARDLFIRLTNMWLDSDAYSVYLGQILDDEDYEPEEEL